MEGNEAGGVFERQGPQEHSIDNGEDSGAGADAESQSSDRHGSEAGIFAELPKTVAAIGQHGMKPSADAFFANLFFDLFDAAKFDPRGSRGFGDMPARMFSSVSIARWA